MLIAHLMPLKTVRLKSLTWMDEYHFLFFCPKEGLSPMARQYCLVILKKGLVIGAGRHRNKRSEL